MTGILTIESRRIIGDIRKATLAARERTGDNAIGVAVQQGRFQVQRVTYPKGLRGRSHVEELGAYLPAAEALAFLNSMGAP